ncbi:MAG: hypothetical protein M3O24_02470 [Thermoproteota archaeon]|nr:hypothetical protein [Thermoproteota archaeon]
MESIDINDTTYKRLSTVRVDLMDSKKKDLDYDDVINHLIDTYQDGLWGHLGAEASGG